MRPELLTYARSQLQDADPSVRITALGPIESVDPINRILAASPLLTDPVRSVRIEAARILADVPDSQIPASRLSARKSAMTKAKSNCAKVCRYRPMQQIYTTHWGCCWCAKPTKRRRCRNLL